MYKTVQHRLTPSWLPLLVNGSGMVLCGRAGWMIMAAPLTEGWVLFTNSVEWRFGLLGVACVAGGLGWLGMGAPLPSAVAVQPVEIAAYGRALFVATGCNTCHLHAAALNTWSTERGPNLTDYQNTTDYLQGWLKDPQAVKPNTEMPNLALQAHEIEALAAFLIQGQD